MARINFNPQQVRPYSGSVQTLPAGSYDVEIVAEKEQDLRDGRSRALVLDYQVLNGQFKGQRIRDNINLWHVNQDAAKLAQSRIVAIAHAVGVPSFMDTSELHHRPFSVVLSSRVYNGKEYNNVDEYSAVKMDQQYQHESVATAPVQNANAPYWS